MTASERSRWRVLDRFITERRTPRRRRAVTRASRDRLVAGSRGKPKCLAVAPAAHAAGHVSSRLGSRLGHGDLAVAHQAAAVDVVTIAALGHVDDALLWLG